ncbi:MAG TPA: hypothetical protein VFY36_12440 [Solirubrobacteraceae bacterium]|nr:hypothetical protein [Solirubrobacteraceae bacterium]
MRRATTTAMGLVALVVMLVLGVFSAGSASAQLFLYTGPLPALILVLNDNNQIFTVEPASEIAFQITCRHFRGHGTTPIATMKAASVIIIGTYSKCEATGGIPATVTPAEYEIGADGSVSVLKSIVITVAGAAKCSVKVNSGGPNDHLLLLLFLNNPSGDILAHVEVSGIRSLSSGGVCGGAGVEKTEGTYFGLLLVWAHGGSIKWDPTH